VEALDYDDPVVKAREVHVQTQVASEKHGITVAGFDNVNLRGHTFEDELRLFLPADAPAIGETPSTFRPRNTVTTRVGIVVAVGAEVG